MRQSKGRPRTEDVDIAGPVDRLDRLMKRRLVQNIDRALQAADLRVDQIVKKVPLLEKGIALVIPLRQADLLDQAALNARLHLGKPVVAQFAGKANDRRRAHARRAGDLPQSLKRDAGIVLGDIIGNFLLRFGQFRIIRLNTRGNRHGVSSLKYCLVPFVPNYTLSAPVLSSENESAPIE